MATINGTQANDLVVGTGKSDAISTGAGNDTIIALSGNDTINAGSGNDNIDSGAGNDTIDAGSGNDAVLSGSGDDVIDAGSGNDIVFSELGNDIIIHRYGENIGAKDYYDGGLGQDTLRLVFTSAEWARADVQADIAAYLAQATNLSNRILNPLGLSTLFTFKSMGVTVVNIERLQVSVDGVLLDPRNEAVTARADTVGLTEDSPAVSLDILANDSVPDRAVSVTLLNAGIYGTASLAPSLNGAVQTAAFSYVPSVAVQSLGAGQTVTETISYKVVDVNGDASVSTVTITITGTNDAAIIGTPTVTAVTEDANVTAGKLTASGTLSINDADQNQSSFQTVVTPVGTTLGTLTLAANVAYSYSVANSAVQYLGAGETRVETFTVKALDGTTKDIAFTITGTNDAALIGSPAAAVVTEDTNVTAGTLSASGMLSINDADQNQSGFQTTVTPVGTPLGTLTLAANGAYSYSVANSAVQYLGAGETRVETFTVKSLDGTTKDIAFTITGTNDAALIGSPAAAVVTEDSNVTSGTISASGTLSINDADQNQSGFQTTVTPVGTPLGTLTLAANGAYSYSVANSAVQYLGAGETRVETFTVKSLDGTTKDIAFTITGTNDAALIGSPAAAVVTEDSNVTSGTISASGTLTINDADQNQSSFLTTVTPVGTTLGTLTLAANGAYSYSVANSAVQSLGEGETRVETFTVTALDGTTKDIAFTITGTNDAPTVTGAVTDATEAGSASSTLDALANASDVDAGTTLSVVNIQSNLPAGVTYHAASHTFTLDPANAAYTSLSFGQQRVVTVTFDVFDGIATTSTTVSWTVTGTNQAPVVVANAPSQLTTAAGNLNAGAAFALDLNTFFSDSDGDTLTITADQIPAGFTLVNGVLTQTSASDPASAGDYALTVTADDGHGGVVTKDVTFTIALENNYSDNFAQFATATVNGSSASDTVAFGKFAGGINGNVSANGGDGDDSLSFGSLAGGNSGTVTADGDGGDDTISFADTAGYSLGNVSANGGEGNDTISFGDYAGLLQGKANANGGAGNDTITFGSSAGSTTGVASADGGEGDDTIVFGSDAAIGGTVTVDAGSGADTVSFGTAAGVSGTLSIDLGAGDLAADRLSFAGAATATVTSFEIGTDKIALDVNANTLTLTENGNDVRISGSGIDLTIEDVGTGHSLTEFLVEKPWAAVIGSASATSVTEDTNVVSNQLTATGSIAIRDLNAGEAAFKLGIGDNAVSNGWNAAGSQASGGPAWGTLRMKADGSYIYSVQNSSAHVQALGANETHVDTFTVTAADGTTQTVSFTINGTNEANVAPNASNDTALVNANAVLNVAAVNGLLSNDTDPDGGALSIVDLPGLVSLNDTDGDGIADYLDNAPAVANANQADMDGDGVGDAVDPNPSTFGDVRQTISPIGVTQRLANGALLTVSADGSYSYDPTGSAAFKALKAGQTATQTFTYLVQDAFGATDTATTTITVQGVNDAPVYTGPEILNMGAGGSLATSAEKYSINLKALFADADGDAITLAGLSLPMNFSGSDTVSGDWFGVLPSSYAGDYGLTITASDGQGGVTTQNVTLSVALKNNYGDNFGQSATIAVNGTSIDDVMSFGTAAGNQSGALNVQGGAGNDTISFGTNAAGYDGTATAVGGDGNDTISFSSNAGQFSGTAAASGGDGQDSIIFGNIAGYNSGTAIATGGTGNDTISFGVYAGYTNGNVTVDAGSGSDLISFGTYAGITNGKVTVDAGSGSDTITFGTNAGTSGTLSIALGLNDLAADTLTFQGTVNATVTDFEVGIDHLSLSTSALTLTESGNDVHLTSTANGIDLWLIGVGSGHTADEFLL